MRDMTARPLQIDRESGQTLSRARHEAARAWQQIDRVKDLLSKLADEWEESADRVKKV